MDRTMKRLSWSIVYDPHYRASDKYLPKEQMASLNTCCNYYLFCFISRLDSFLFSVFFLPILSESERKSEIFTAWKRLDKLPVCAILSPHNEMQNLNTMLFMGCVYAVDALYNRWRSTASIEKRKLSMFMFYLFVLLLFGLCVFFSFLSFHSIRVHYCSHRTFLCAWCFFFSFNFVFIRGAHI